MAITHKVHSQKYREAQYELFYELLSDGVVTLGNQRVLIGVKKLDDPAIKKLMTDKIIPQFLAIESMEQEKTYCETEVSTMLIEKGYLEVGQTIDDLPIKADEVK